MQPTPQSRAQAALWLALFHNASSLLADFHQQLGDLDISISPWRQKGGFLVLLRMAAPIAVVCCDTSMRVACSMVQFAGAIFHHCTRVCVLLLSADDVRRRVMRYTTPLKNPLGPRQARNTGAFHAQSGLLGTVCHVGDAPLTLQVAARSRLPLLSLSCLHPCAVLHLLRVQQTK